VPKIRKNVNRAGDSPRRSNLYEERGMRPDRARGTGKGANPAIYISVSSISDIAFGEQDIKITYDDGITRIFVLPITLLQGARGVPPAAFN